MTDVGAVNVGNRENVISLDFFIYSNRDFDVEVHFNSLSLRTGFKKSDDNSV